MTLKQITARIRAALSTMDDTPYDSNAYAEASINLRIAVRDLERATSDDRGMPGEVHNLFDQILAEHGYKEPK